ncbi:MAG: archaemetzincin family Zn-dependent metalloprotease [Planctomycetes bacterium]|nr:archaemetzincin family Zn-dependent metalloprotease [Planctomycetota bacterium]
MPGLTLVPVGAVPAGFLSALSARIVSLFAFETVRARDPLDPSFSRDPERGQLHSTRLLEALAAACPPGDGERILGVADADLFIPILTFVFGEAQLSGPAAVLSLTRLRPEFYGLPRDDSVLLARTVKEALHELGHTYGLLHCRRPDCVMRASTNAGEVDLKPALFCRSCAAATRS